MKYKLQTLILTFNLLWTQNMFDGYSVSTGIIVVGSEMKVGL